MFHSLINACIYALIYPIIDPSIHLGMYSYVSTVVYSVHIDYKSCDLKKKSYDSTLMPEGLMIIRDPSGCPGKSPRLQTYSPVVGIT